MKLTALNPNYLKNFYSDDLIDAYIDTEFFNASKKGLIQAGGQFEPFNHYRDCGLGIISILNDWNKLHLSQKFVQKRQEKYSLKAKNNTYAHGYRRIPKDFYNAIIIVPRYKAFGISKEEKLNITMDRFRDSIFKVIEKYNKTYGQNVDMHGSSFGGYMTIMCSHHDHLDFGVPIHAPICGTLFSFLPEYDELKKQKDLILTDKIVFQAMDLLETTDYGFGQSYVENPAINGKLRNLGDWSKLEFIGGSINYKKVGFPFNITGSMLERLGPKNEHGQSIYTNDGFIYTSEKDITNLGAKYHNIEGQNHFMIENENNQHLAAEILYEKNNGFKK